MTFSINDNFSDFAIIGHQTNWDEVISIINNLRDSHLKPIPENDIKYLFPIFPPRSIFNVEVISTLKEKKIKGKYIETFISPDKITGKEFLRENIRKINQAAKYAINHNSSICTLGGFSSIVLEGNLNLLPPSKNSKFTTGNTLTAAFIVQGVIKACELLSIELNQSNMLILGATGDLGSACARYFENKVNILNLTGRNLKKLKLLKNDISKVQCNISLVEDDFLLDADIVISVTSSTGINLSTIKKHSLVVDAGYPKNLMTDSLPKGVRVFHGGMGLVKGGFEFFPILKQPFYSLPLPGIAHGCILESFVLAFEKRYEEYSTGKGNIKQEKMDEIFKMSEKHGIILSPFYNQDGLWPENKLN